MRIRFLLFRNRGKNNSPQSGFTLIELLVVIAIIAILAALLLPALARAKDQGRQAQCISNKKQMQVAWQMYADDFQNYMVLNAPLGVLKLTDSWCPGVGESWSAVDDNTNIANYKQTLLAPYLVSQVAVYKCPGDTILSANGERLRSVSMNSQMGWLYLSTNPAGANINYSAPLRVYIKTTDLSCPAPSMAFIFADETMYTLDDGFMQMGSPTAPSFPNAPAHYHSGGASFGFADGHAEAHVWKGPVLPKLPYAYPLTANGVDNNTTATDRDWLWLLPRSGCTNGALP